MDTQSCYPPLHTLGSPSKPLLIQAFCSRLSVYLHPSARLCQHLLKCERVRWVSFYSLFCALHVRKHAQWRGWTLQLTKPFCMSTFPLLRPVLCACAFVAAIPPSLEACLLPYTLVSACPKAGLGIDRLCEMLADLLWLS